MPEERDRRPGKTNPYDQAFKFLAEEDPESLLLLVGAIQPGESARIELLPREVDMSSLFPDQPYLVTKGHQKRITHIEAQTEWPRNMPERMTEYGVLISLKKRLPVDSYVLLLTPRKLPKYPPSEGVIEIGDLRITKKIHIICVWELSAAEALATGREALLPFVPLMQGDQTALDQAALRVKQVRNEPRRLKIAGHFLALGGLRYNRFDLLELVGRTEMLTLEQLKASDFVQYILEEGMEKGMEKGMKKGIEKGREEGREAVLDLFGLLVGYRFPGIQLGDEVERVRDLNALRKLCHELDQIPDADALRQRLAQLAASPQAT